MLRCTYFACLVSNVNVKNSTSLKYLRRAQRLTRFFVVCVQLRFATTNHVVYIQHTDGSSYLDMVTSDGHSYNLYHKTRATARTNVRDRNIAVNSEL